MSEEKIKTEPVEDEENLKTTPVRDTIRDKFEANGHTDDEQDAKRPIAPEPNANDRKCENSGENLVVEVKVEPIDGNNDKSEDSPAKQQEQIIETLVAGTTNLNTEPKTPEKVDKGKNRDVSRGQESGATTKEPTPDVEVKTEPEIDQNVALDSNERSGPTLSSNMATENSLSEIRSNDIPQRNTGIENNIGENASNDTPSENEVRVKTEPNETTVSQPSNPQTEATSPSLTPAPRLRDSDTDGIATAFIPPTPRLRDSDTDGISTPFIKLPKRSRNYEADEVTFSNNSNFPLSKDSDADGIATPRISLPPRPSDADTDGIATPRIFLPPPSTPRPKDSDADGIATPRISIAPMSRLRVKTELSLFQTPTAPANVAETSSLPQDFFADLLTVNKRSESGEATPNNSDDARSQDGPIPDDFFDDLLRDQLKERIEEARNQDLEIKYSDRLKELEKLENELKKHDEKCRERKKNHKKQKKSKKKSHKRSRSRSPSNNSREKERDQYRHRRSPTPDRRQRRSPTPDRRHRRSSTPDHIKKKRSRLSTPPPAPSLQQIPSTSNYGNLNKVSMDTTRSFGGATPTTGGGIKVKSEYRSIYKANENINNNYDLNTDVEMSMNPVKVEPQPPVLVCDEIEEPEEVLTPKQKIERAKQRAASLIAHLKNMSSQTNDSPLSTFLFTSTVRKLPASHSYVNQQIYENRSPLHTVNNVNYKFNSHATRFNLEEWGLVSLPAQAAKVAKLLGCDAQTIHNKLKSIKIPAKLLKIKTESSNDQGAEELMETASSFFCNAMTQTDDVQVSGIQRKTQGYEIGIQVEPTVCHAGCQTLETQSPTKNNQSGDPDELPIMKVMRDLNENQLMAIHDFAELIKEPAANAMEMYSLKVRMLDIYKCSQIPSALEAPPPSQVINNYTTSSMRSSPQTQRRSAHLAQPIIQSVSAADGSHFSINDPRAKSAAYKGRASANSKTSSSSSSNYDSRYSAFAQPNVNRSLSNSESRSSSHQPPTSSSSSTKYYGRGGLRR